MNIHDFDAIRPVLPEELPAAIDELFADEQFRAVVHTMFPDTPAEALRAQLAQCHTSLDIQKTFFYPLIYKLVAECSRGIRMDASAIPADRRTQPYTFISNHRDIVLDSGFLDILLIDNGFGNTVEIAIGDNLLIHPWIRTLVRVNKSFIVRRSLPVREMLAASKLMSEYMHFAIAEKREGIWIAQREGRAKDANDRTQEALLKMMALGGTGTPLERLKQLSLVPLAISYEFDPCDYLKAQEYQQKRDNPDFKKQPQDDLLNMQTGIFGYKGHVVYRPAAPANTWLDECEGLPKAELFKAVAGRIDKAIHRNYEIFPANHVALDLLQGSDTQSAHYTPADKAAFEDYVAGQLARVTLPQPDLPFLRERLLTMYANPLVNHLKALA